MTFTLKTIKEHEGKVVDRIIEDRNAVIDPVHGRNTVYSNTIWGGLNHDY
jgi:hypothetical protein